MPHVGAQVTVEYLGFSVHGVVRLVDDDGRHVEVETEDGRHEIFALNRATATFTAGGGQTGARLRFA